MTPSGPERGLAKHLKNNSKNDYIWGPLLSAFWGHVGAQIVSIKRYIKPEGSKIISGLGSPWGPPRC